MAAVLVNICFDPRLNHEAIRKQVRDRAGSDLASHKVFVVGDAGGNFGSGARNAIAMFARLKESVVIAALLHHDDCVAASLNMRQGLQASAKALESELRGAGFQAPVLTGAIVTDTSTIIWSDRPQKSLEVLPFRMPRMYGR
jgi:hypothetical protein